MVCPRQTGVVNPTTEVCRTRQQGWQGKARQGGGGKEKILGNIGGGGAPEEAERSMMVFSVWAARPA